MIAFLERIGENRLRAISVAQVEDEEGGREFVEFSIPDDCMAEVEIVLAVGTPVFDVEFDAYGGATISTYSQWSKLN